MRASEAGYSHNEESIMVEHVRTALGDLAPRYWVNWTRDNRIELVHKSSKRITVSFNLDTVFPETADGRRPLIVATGFRQVAVDAINALIQTLKKD